MFSQSLLLVFVLACADPNEQSISVRGVGTKTIKPDQAHVFVYASGNGILVSDALADADKRVQAIVEAVRKADSDVSAPEVVTVSIGKEEQRIWRPEDRDEGRPQVIRRILFKLPPAPDRAALLADAAIRAGGLLDLPRSSHFSAEINSNIYYTVKDESKVQHELIKAAVEDARVKAEQLASVAGKTVGDILCVTADSGQGEMYMFPLEKGRLMKLYVGTDPEKLEVRESVNVRFEWHKK